MTKATVKKAAPKKVEPEVKPKAKKTAKEFVEKVAEKVKKLNLVPAPAVAIAPPNPKPKVPEAPFAEAQFAKRNDNKEYTFDVNMPVTLVPLMRDAWDAVRGRGDAAFDQCAGAFKQILLQHTIDVLKTHAVLKGDTNLGRFEREIARIKSINAR